jgi:TPP-dependent 2-oxoacid decarboxylase
MRIGQFLLRRVEEARARRLFGLPHDPNLSIMRLAALVLS